MTQLTERLRLDLPNSLPRDIKLLTHLFERMIGVHVDAERILNTLASRAVNPARILRVASRSPSSVAVSSGAPTEAPRRG